MLEPIEPRRLAWQGPTGPHEFVLAWVPGTSGAPYAFGHGRHRRSMELAGFFISIMPVTQALWERVMGANPAVHQDPALGDQPLGGPPRCHAGRRDDLLESYLHVAIRPRATPNLQLPTPNLAAARSPSLFGSWELEVGS